MRIALVSPELPNRGGFPLAPPILEYLGALTLQARPDAQLRLFDANRRAVSLDELDAELVGISVMTPTATWCYRLADALRARGVQVVLGGIHPTVLPEEAAEHADAVVIGEAEAVWGQVLEDASRRKLRPRYIGERRPLAGLPVPLKGALPGRYPFRAIFTARGCLHSCAFCSVRAFFGSTVRLRPIPEVVRDVEVGVDRIYYNGDDNIWGSDQARSIELFRALADGPKRWWSGQGDLLSVQQPRGEEMLKWAFRSGLRSVWVGYESESPATLARYRALGKQGRDRDEAIRRITGAGMEVVFFVILGGREDSLAAFEGALELSDRLKATVHPILLTPYPGTELYEEYKPYLLPGLPWASYDGVHAVFDHPSPDMTPEAREARVLAINSALFSLPRVLRRVGAIHRRGFPVTHTLALMKQLAMRRGFQRAYRDHVRQQGPS
ncbi:MAG TPA: radical SAM protein [Anaeromyxobacteraceae bacterium]|jgi:radical SAM superfamily enzyme YgiQ (UPF0313 family)|nr:radical SAM protein [Anaeromyxobacteraceae bacterium]